MSPSKDIGEVEVPELVILLKVEKLGTGIRAFSDDRSIVALASPSISFVFQRTCVR